MEVMDPWVAFQQYFNTLSKADIAYTIITFVVFWVVLAVAKRRARTLRPSRVMALVWFIALVAWAFYMLVVAWAKIRDGGVVAFSFLIVSFGLVAVATIRFVLKARVYEQIITGLIGAVVVYGTIAAIGAGSQSIAFAIIMGCVLGLILGLLVATLRRLSSEQLEGSIQADEANQQPISKIDEFIKRKPEQV